eukprot:CAMPEP_0184873198 /NCGR_PEP_ID=MMETSP0580-20130426/41708_1 /TAXON_ID=1118495 /ORGANISM="Dactyliosolen fragilissimus" /LENGTH=157 /DNA_ID=CAMNT_0027376075 /DNA_START=444 /DNA_END=913 /DNA_ORIENTATION=+
MFISKEHASSIKRRVIASLSLMLGGKLVTIQIPFLFKHLVDSLPNESMASIPTTASTTETTETATNTMDALSNMDPSLLMNTTTSATTIPLLLIAGYGISRATASGMQEYRNAVFAHVAQDAIRRVGRSVFDHVHKLDMTFHLTRNTGTLGRILDRG